MKAASRLYNLLAVLVAGLTVVACLGMAVIFADPGVFFNPFKPVRLDDVPAVVTGVTPAATATPRNALSAPSGATASPSATTLPADPTATATAPIGPTEATLTPFPSPVGPTETIPPTEVPAKTATLRPPTPSATHESYPIRPTDVPPTEAPPTSAYP